MFSFTFGFSLLKLDRLVESEKKRYIHIPTYICVCTHTHICCDLFCIYIYSMIIKSLYKLKLLFNYICTFNGINNSIWF